MQIQRGQLRDTGLHTGRRRFLEHEAGILEATVATQFKVNLFKVHIIWKGFANTSLFK